jgi:hypothetical protein
MTDVYAHVHVPNAKRMAARATPNEDVRALVGIIRRTVTGPNGETPTLDDVAALLGISPATLRGYQLKPRTNRSSVQRGVPYTVLYALEVLSASPAGTAAAIWGVK